MIFKLGIGSLGNIGWKKNVGYWLFFFRVFSIKVYICNNVVNIYFWDILIINKLKYIKDS